jgi:hypothetical protein
MFYELAYLGNILDEGDKELEVGEEVEQREHAVFHHQQQDHCKSGNNRGRLSNTSAPTYSTLRKKAPQLWEFWGEKHWNFYDSYR